jgi:hypothetical protein
LASSSARERTSLNCGGGGSMVATTVWFATTGSPALSVTRSCRPANGAVTSYSSLTRVLPSLETVTAMSPKVARATSTGCGSGENSTASSASRSTIAATMATVRARTPRRGRTAVPTSR